MASKLTGLSPVTVNGEAMPQPQLFTNIPMLHRILDAVLEDWLRAVEPWQSQIDEAEDQSKRLAATLYGFADLEPSLLKCLFSYAFFFVAVDDTYRYFYSQLNRVNGLSGLNMKHGKPPRQSPFVKKIGTIRDFAIAHFPSEKAQPIDASAAMTWEPMSLTHIVEGTPDLEKLTFAPGRLRSTDSKGRTVESQDLEVSGLNPNPPKDTDGRREESGRGMRELQGK